MAAINAFFVDHTSLSHKSRIVCMGLYTNQNAMRLILSCRYYCSTVSNRCWPCHLCGNIDIYQSRFTHKCVCDGGLNGDPFAICSNFPPPGHTRQPLIRSDDDIHESLRDRAEGYFNGSKRDQNCPKPNTSTTQSISTLSEGNATTKVVPAPSDGDIFFETTSLATEALTQDQLNRSISGINNADTGDKPATTGLLDWGKFVFIAATVFVVLVFVVLVCLYRSCMLNKQGARRRVRSTPPLGFSHYKNEPPEAPSSSLYVEGPSVSDRLVISDSSEVREIGSSLETADTSFSVPDLFGSSSQASVDIEMDRLTSITTHVTLVADSLEDIPSSNQEFCNCSLSPIKWREIESSLSTFLQDESLRRRFVERIFECSDGTTPCDTTVNGICQRDPQRDFTEFLQDGMTVFNINTHRVMATALRSVKHGDEFSARPDLIDDLLQGLTRLEDCYSCRDDVVTTGFSVVADDVTLGMNV
ncbi:hypothetical protein BSL78_11047 [Apostichopus japonicus]|uniref:Uncharacterized protein n=1 Tax=Stichopus japonicus TaxID=307972 RepID=A0A2G8KVJ6_STIJA|nr:hypothetical protein BSL78_11047 [Apostichopus japonicus]